MSTPKQQPAAVFLRYLGHRPRPGVGAGNFAGPFPFAVGDEVEVGAQPLRRVGRDPAAGLRVVSNVVGYCYATIARRHDGALRVEVFGAAAARHNDERFFGARTLVAGDVLSIADAFDFVVVTR